MNSRRVLMFAVIGVAAAILLLMANSLLNNDETPQQLDSLLTSINKAIYISDYAVDESSEYSLQLKSTNTLAVLSSAKIDIEEYYTSKYDKPSSTDDFSALESELEEASTQQQLESLLNKNLDSAIKEVDNHLASLASHRDEKLISLVEEISASLSLID